MAACKTPSEFNFLYDAKLLAGICRNQNETDNRIWWVFVRFMLLCVCIYILYTYLQYVFTFFIVLNLALCLPSAKLASCFCRCSQPMLKPILSGCRNDSIKTKILKVVQEVYGGADVKYSDTWWQYTWHMLKHLDLYVDQSWYSIVISICRLCSVCNLQSTLEIKSWIIYSSSLH